jgi:hypothetical protein
MNEISAYLGSIFDQTSDLEILIGFSRKRRQSIAETTGVLICTVVAYIYVLQTSRLRNMCNF